MILLDIILVVRTLEEFSVRSRSHDNLSCLPMYNMDCCHESSVGLWQPCETNTIVELTFALHLYATYFGKAYAGFIA